MLPCCVGFRTLAASLPSLSLNLPWALTLAGLLEFLCRLNQGAQTENLLPLAVSSLEPNILIFCRRKNMGFFAKRWELLIQTLKRSWTAASPFHRHHTKWIAKLSSAFADLSTATLTCIACCYSFTASGTRPLETEREKTNKHVVLCCLETHIYSLLSEYALLIVL